LLSWTFIGWAFIISSLEMLHANGKGPYLKNVVICRNNSEMLLPLGQF
jgi:hypothetical protein